MTQDNANHDAVPAAIARTDADRNRTDKAALRPGKGAGNTHPTQTTPGECSKPSEGTSEPVAWEVYWEGAARVPYLVSANEKPSNQCDPPPRCVPLYRSPTLTDAEREAVESAVDFCECTDKPLPRSEQIATLRKLLERMGGGR